MSEKERRTLQAQRLRGADRTVPYMYRGTRVKIVAGGWTTVQRARVYIVVNHVPALGECRVVDEGESAPSFIIRDDHIVELTILDELANL